MPTRCRRSSRARGAHNFRNGFFCRLSLLLNFYGTQAPVSKKKCFGRPVPSVETTFTRPNPVGDVTKCRCRYQISVLAPCKAGHLNCRMVRFLRHRGLSPVDFPIPPSKPSIPPFSGLVGLTLESFNLGRILGSRWSNSQVFLYGARPQSRFWGLDRDPILGPQGSYSHAEPTDRSADLGISPNDFIPRLRAYKGNWGPTNRRLPQLHRSALCPSS